MKAILQSLILPLAVLIILGAAAIWTAQRYPMTFGALLLALITYGLVQGFISRKRDRQRGWRTGPAGRDQIYYEEMRDGQWQRITIHAELMATGKVHRVIYLSSLHFPAWATHREHEILQRLKTDYPPPRYEYE